MVNYIGSYYNRCNIDLKNSFHPSRATQLYVVFLLYDDIVYVCL